MAEDSAASTYILGTEERRRLELLEECFDPITDRALSAVGIKPGWRCLEVGAGGGSVTRSLCSRVGPTGRVVAVDLDTRFVEELDDDNLEVVERDIVRAGLPGNDYDLIHARMLLMHLPTREKVLEEMAAALRPGGWLLIEDLDFFPVLSATEGPYGDVFRLVVDTFEAGGVTTTLGRQLPGLFDRAGLDDVDVVCQVPVYRGGSPFAELTTHSLIQLRSAILATGATEAQLDEFARQINDPREWFTHFAIYAVRGRAPEG